MTRITLTKEQYSQIWKIKKNCKYKSLRDNKTLGDYFVAITAGETLVLFDTIKEARDFNDSVTEAFHTRFFPTD